MNPLIKKMFFLNRSALIVLTLIALSVIIILTTTVLTRRLLGSNESLRSQIVQMQELAGSVNEIKGLVESRENKIRAHSGAGIVSTMENMLQSLGMKAKTIKPTEKKRIDEFMEENSDIEIDGTDLNSIVNLLYKIESSPVPLKIQGISIRSSFENPDRFVLKLTVALMGKS